MRAKSTVMEDDLTESRIVWISEGGGLSLLKAKFKCVLNASAMFTGNSMR